MRVLTAGGQGTWLKSEQNEQDKPDEAIQEARRVLSDLFRCENLVVLSGLGTSLCVKNTEGQREAPTMWDLWTSVKKLQEEGGGLPWDDLMALVKHPKEDSNLETLLSRCKLAQGFLDGEDLENLNRFVALAEGDIKVKVSFIKQGHNVPHHLEFLRRVARRTNRKTRTKVFTTNYDLCFEEAGRQGRFVVIDGFSPTQPPTFDAVYFTYDIVRRERDGDTSNFIPNVFHLYKVHGSVDWEQDEESGEIRKTLTPGNPLLIYPRSSKYELAFAQPYLEMMSALQAALREPNTGLLVVGFGFNDNHLAEPVLSAVRSNLSLKTVVVTPRVFETPPAEAGGAPGPGEVVTNPHIKKLGALISGGDARLALIGCTFDELIPHIPDLMAETDLERHAERVRKLEVR